jgi:GNAT superfamily N-acetyltransferase
MIQGAAREWHQGDYTISTDDERLDLPLIHDFISNRSYWGQGRKVEIVKRALEHSFNFGLYKDSRQVGFARVVTDFATFAWVADVFVLEEFRGQGLAKWLMQVILSHEDLQGFRRWVLATRDAHNLYARFGFIPLHRPERWMERPDPKMQESPDYWNKDASI